MASTLSDPTRECLKLLGEARWVEALALAERLSSESPLEESPHRLRFIALQNLRRLDEAAAAARKAIMLAAAPANAHFLLATVRHQQYLDEAAEAEAAMAVELEPDVPIYRHLLAQVVLFSQPERAEALLRVLVEQEPDDASILNDLGCVTERRDRGEARALYLRAAAMAPQSNARLNLRRLRWAGLPKRTRGGAILLTVSVLAVAGVTLGLGGLLTRHFDHAAGGALVVVGGFALLRGVIRLLNRPLRRNPSPIRTIDTPVG